MANRTTSTRIGRLDELKGLLREREFVTAPELARELCVSLRTLNRDLALLREAGVPLDSDRGRGGGLRLDRSWSLGRLHLRKEEAIDLLLSMAIAEKLNSPLLLHHLASMRRKIVVSFGEAEQLRIRSLRKRILVGAPASVPVLSGYQPPTRAQLGLINDAFLSQHCIAIEYVDRDGAATTREVEPQFLFYSAPVWYLLAFDLLRKDIRFFRVDRLRKVEKLKRTFRIARPEPFLAAVEANVAAI